MTRVVAVLAAGSPPDVSVAQFDFHVAAGADAVLIGDRDNRDETRELVERRGDDSRLHVTATRRAASRAELGRSAIQDHDADWVIDLRPGEFWWPRGESFQDVLAPMPPRYGVVQALVRRFVLAAADGNPSTWDRAVVRDSLLVHPPAPGTPPAALLRPVFRAHDGLDLGDPAGGVGTRQPLRAWYPLEVLTVADTGESADAAAVERGLVDGSLVVDERLAEALRALAEGRQPVFAMPTIVDEAAYAGECSAVGEVDLESLDAQIRELEAQVAELEARFWPRVQRLATRAVRRVRRP